MGNKSTSPSRDPDIEKTQREEANNTETASGIGPRGPPCPSPDLLASLQSLGEHSDHTLLPQSLHQIAEAYSLEEEYHWAVQFLQLERLYHERLLSNLAALQEDWESQWRERNRAAESTSPGETNSIGQEHIEMLSQICRTHQRPMLSAEKSMADTVLKDNHNTRGQCERNESETSPSHHGKVRGNNPVKQGEEDLEQTTSTGADPAMDEEKGGVEEGEGGVEEMEQEGQEVFEESPEEEVQVVEWPAGFPKPQPKTWSNSLMWRRSDPRHKENQLRKRQAEEHSCTFLGGLVSILKRRRASLDGLPPEGPDSAKQNFKRKVRFSEPEDGMEPDEVGGDSCLILLLLCLVTVVISLGGTALYCTLVDTYSSICTDFSHNIDFSVVQVRRFLDGLRHWWLERML